MELRTYLTADERAPFDGWLAALPDVQARARIRARLARVQAAAIKQAVAYLNDWRKRGEP